jgi:hypothetical protein
MPGRCHNTPMEWEENKFSTEMQISYEICLPAYILKKQLQKNETLKSLQEETYFKEDTCKQTLP